MTGPLCAPSDRPTCCSIPVRCACLSWCMTLMPDRFLCDCLARSLLSLFKLPWRLNTLYICVTWLLTSGDHLSSCATCTLLQRYSKAVFVYSDGMRDLNTVQRSLSVLFLFPFDADATMTSVEWGNAVISLHVFLGGDLGASFHVWGGALVCYSFLVAGRGSVSQHWPCTHCIHWPCISPTPLLALLWLPA